MQLLLKLQLILQILYLNLMVLFVVAHHTAHGPEVREVLLAGVPPPDLVFFELIHQGLIL